MHVNFRQLLHFLLELNMIRYYYEHKFSQLLVSDDWFLPTDEVINRRSADVSIAFGGRRGLAVGFFVHKGILHRHPKSAKSKLPNRSKQPMLRS